MRRACDRGSVCISFRYRNRKAGCVQVSKYVSKKSLIRLRGMDFSKKKAVLLFRVFRSFGDQQFGLVLGGLNRAIQIGEIG